MEYILGFYLEDKDEFKEFISCYNRKVPSESQIEFRGERVNIKTAIKKTTRESQKLSKVYEAVIKILEKSKDKRGDSKIYTYLKELKTYNNMLARLIEVYIYLEYQNTAKADATVKEILSLDFFEHIFTSDVQNIEAKEQKDMILFLLNKFSKSRLHKDALNALVFYLHFHATSDLKDSIDKKFDVAKSIAQVQRKYQRVLYGQELPFVWAPSIYENSSLKEHVRFINESYKNREILGDSELLFFRSFPSIKKHRKENLLNFFLKLQSSKSLYSKFVYFTLLEDESFYRFATSGTSQKIGLLISEKRKYLISLLKSDGLREYALLSLLNIGDLNRSYIESFVLRNE